MYRFPIGVMIESFCTDFKSALKAASKLGASGIQMSCARGEHAPESMSPAARRETLDMVKSCGLSFSAICGDLGCGFGDPARNPELIEKSKRIIDLALSLETNIVTTHIGVVPDDPSHERYSIMQAACHELALYADSLGARFAVESGPEPSLVLKGFLDSLGTKGIGVNLDPANLVMVTGDDPVGAVYNLRDYIVHTHAKDGVKLLDGNPEYIYRVVQPIPKELQGKRFFREVPLGMGSVPFAAYLGALEDIGYKGYLTIERAVGEDPEADIALAVRFLRDMIRG